MSRRLDSLWFAIAVLVLWQALHWLGGEEALSSPIVTLTQAANLLGAESFWGHVAATGQAFLWAALLSIILGLGIGLALGLWRTAGEVMEPVLNSLYAIPKITLYPVILLFFGLGLPAKIAFGTIHGVFPIILLTINGVRAVKPVIRKTARALGLSPLTTIRTILLPAALPEIFTGLRIGIALTLLGTLIGELFASNRGLGYLMMRAAERQDIPTITALILLLFVTAAVIGAGLLAIDRRLHHHA